jgi:5-methylcytosine-specific restriction endonuclease McrA
MTSSGPTKRRRILPTEKHALSLRFEHRCAACRSLLPAGWHADHVVALADGGADDARNMQPLCPHCHTLKTALENSARPRPRVAAARVQAHIEHIEPHAETRRALPSPCVPSQLKAPLKLERRGDGWF